MKTYKDAGVDIEAGNEFVKTLKPLAKTTSQLGVRSGIGGFGAVFDIWKMGYTDPLLIAATDGVGTKLQIAIEIGIHDTIGIDLVAMCVNDIVCSGAAPLFFLDYFATGKLEKAVAFDIMQGITEGCKIANCAFIGGETAEMPGFYQNKKYDLAGFAIGAVERKNLLTGETIQSGDAIIGLQSSGLHSNGFSLVRDIVNTYLMDYNKPSPFDGKKLGESLLVPTRIYTGSCLQVLQSDIGSKIKGLAHITGGGLDNILRILPEGLTTKLNTWPVKPIFHWLRTHISAEEMRKTFNCGIGMAVIVSPSSLRKVMEEFVHAGELPVIIGYIENEI